MPRCNSLPRLTYCLVLALLFTDASPGAEPLPTKEERLGPWHYLYPLEYYPTGVAKNGYRLCSWPTAVTFGPDRTQVAALLPGSLMVAEFRAGSFFDLHLPAGWEPNSLAVDRQGVLHCLAQRTTELKAGMGWAKRSVLRMGAGGWEVAGGIQYDNVDRLEFDAANRLWALGRSARVGFLEDGKWKTFQYVDACDPSCVALRLAEDGDGNPVLFTQAPTFPSMKIPEMPGTLTWRDGKFHRDAKASTTALRVAEQDRMNKGSDDADLERAKGYAAHPEVVYAGYRSDRTVLRAGGFVFVSLAGYGLAWANEAELAAAPPLRNDEWETVRDVTVPPALDPQGALWVGRGATLMKVTADKTEAMKGSLPQLNQPHLEFDPLGRPWIFSYSKPILVCRDGELFSYEGFEEALRAESAALPPGRVFPLAIKTPAGLLAFCGEFGRGFFIMQDGQTHSFWPGEIDPQYREPRIGGHGYNPFNNGEPWYDAKGRIYTRIDDHPFCYDPARHHWQRADPKAAQASAPPPSPNPPVPEPFRARVAAAAGPPILFHGFHFYAQEAGGERPLDTGLNPLAVYPFFTGWTLSPGNTQPTLGPDGRLWVTQRNQYTENREWLVLRRK